MCTKKLFILIVVVLFHASSFGAEYLSELKSKDDKKRGKAAQSIRNDQEILINELIKLVEQYKPFVKSAKLGTETITIEFVGPGDTKHLAITLLGDLRASKAIPMLLKNVEYSIEIPFNPEDVWKFKERRKPAKSPDKIYENYPAIEALTKIGMPAIDPVIEKLRTYDKECQGRQNCFWIIHNVLGVKLGRYKLQLSIEEAKDETVKKNLQAVLPLFKTLQK